MNKGFHLVLPGIAYPVDMVNSTIASYNARRAAGADVYSALVMTLNPVYSILEGVSRAIDDTNNGCPIGVIAMDGVEAFGGIVGTVGLAAGGVAVGGGVKAAVGAFRGAAASSVARVPSEAFHYTRIQNVSGIQAKGLFEGAYATPSGELSPLQAQLDLALPPNRGLPESMIRIDLNGLREAGYNVPAGSQVGRSFNMPGGGNELYFPYLVRPEFLTVVR